MTIARNEEPAEKVEAPRTTTSKRAMPIGECKYCDAYRDDPMMPYHVASPNCQSGKYAHCTCDTCF